MMRFHCFALVVGTLCISSIAGAQTPGIVGSEEEEYLRWLQVAGLVPLHEWTARPFSSRELQRIAPPASGHPWSFRPSLRVREGPGPQISLLPLANYTSVNTGFPWGYNDGPVWQGRGFTTALSAGVAASWGPLSLTLLPIAFAAQNAAFVLEDNGRTDSLRFAHGYDPLRIDAPQRFGDRAYGRIDPGQSTLRLDLPVATIGLSTANEWWGPAGSQPILLGTNAGGFPHVFLGSSEPLNVGFGTVSGRLLWGDLRQSAFTQNVTADARRLATGIAGAFRPRGANGLEIGGGRFFQEAWPSGGLTWSTVARPLSGFLRTDRVTDPANPAADPPNQTASIWMRWAVPSSGVEFYAEYGKDDDNWDLRDYIGEPENTGAHVFGLRKLWSLSQGSFWSLALEQLDSRPSQWTTGRPGAGVFYRHAPNITQGFTHRGQILGSAFGVDGFASSIALNRYTSTGRWRLAWMRALQQDARNVQRVLGGRVERVTAYDPDGFDIVHAISFEALRFRGPLTFSGGLSAMYEFNRYLGNDAANLHAWVGVSWDPAGSGRTDRRETGDERRETRDEVRSIPHFGLGASTLDVGGPAVERARVDQILGGPTDGLLLRSPSSLMSRSLRSSLVPRLQSPTRPRVTLLAPEIRLVRNSALPFSLNDGPLWAGAGNNVLATGGLRAAFGPLTLTLAPQVAWSENKPFEMPDPRFFPIPIPASRDSLASPFHIRPGSIDLPVRFGTSGFTKVTSGQSTAAVHFGAVETGLSTENQWWGPGIRNAIVLSNNAPGFPHFFVRSGRPLATPIGDIEGRWLAGGLSESRYFDRDSSNNLRSISALALTWRLKWVPDLTLGVTRSVYAPVSGWGDVPLDFFNAVFSYPGRPNDRTMADSTQTPGPDQIYSWFGRWVFPAAGLEIYGEFAKTELPSSLRDLLVSPGHTNGYTLGLQWAKPLSSGDSAPVLRLQAEHTWLEKSATFRQKPIGTYYTSPAVIQGYTNEGQVLGASIGPGASSHWLALDYVARHWEAGVFGGRIRWDNDGLYTASLANFPYLSYWCMHDVSLFGGVRGGYRGALGTVAASITTGTRYDIWFRNTFVCGQDFDPSRATDVANTTLEVQYTIPF